MKEKVLDSETWVGTGVGACTGDGTSSDNGDGAEEGTRITDDGDAGVGVLLYCFCIEEGPSELGEG